MTSKSAPPISVLIFTLNEELNLPACLDSLDWCEDVVVIDSFSTDRTLDICQRYHVRYFQNEFTGFGDQRNYALENVDLKHDWILILDADERVAPMLAAELTRLAESAPLEVGAYRIRRRFYLWGKWLRYSSLYPTWVVRFVHRDKVRYMNRGHSETECVQGETREICADLIDENHKNLDAWFERQYHYACKEAEFELKSQSRPLHLSCLFSDNPMLRRATLKRIASALPFRGMLYFLYCYFIRLGFLDGRDGFTFCRMKAMYQNTIALKKHELKKSLIQTQIQNVDPNT